MHTDLLHRGELSASSMRLTTRESQDEYALLFRLPHLSVIKCSPVCLIHSGSLPTERCEPCDLSARSSSICRCSLPNPTTDPPAIRTEMMQRTRFELQSRASATEVLSLAFRFARPDVRQVTVILRGVICFQWPIRSKLECLNQLLIQSLLWILALN